MGELASGCKREDHHTGIEWVGLWGVMSVRMDCCENAAASILQSSTFLTSITVDVGRVVSDTDQTKALALMAASRV